MFATGLLLRGKKKFAIVFTQSGGWAEERIPPLAVGPAVICAAVAVIGNLAVIVAGVACAYEPSGVSSQDSSIADPVSDE